MIRLATVGTSNICQNFLDGVRLTEKFVLSAVYSRSHQTGKSFGDKNNCDRVYCSLKEMAESGEVDAVYIASPNSCHYYQSKLFLENGINVICEKPIVTKADEYIELKALADSKNLIYMEAIIPRHTEQYSAVKSALREIGKIRSARLDFSQYSSRLDSFLQGEHVNIFDMSLKAGCLMDIGVYCVYAAIDLLGVPKSLKAYASYLYNGADGSGSAILNYDDFLATLTYSKTCNGLVGSEIIGTEGTLRVEKISQYAGVTLIKNGVETRIAEYPTKAQLMSGEAMRFAEYILDYNSNKSDYKNVGELTFNVHKTMDLIKQNAELIYSD